jgi:hypothetical protein
MIRAILFYLNLGRKEKSLYTHVQVVISRTSGDCPEKPRIKLPEGIDAERI